MPTWLARAPRSGNRHPSGPGLASGPSDAPSPPGPERRGVPRHNPEGIASSADHEFLTRDTVVAPDTAMPGCLTVRPGVPSSEAVAWARDQYHLSAVEDRQRERALMQEQLVVRFPRSLGTRQAVKRERRLKRVRLGLCACLRA